MVARNSAWSKQHVDVHGRKMAYVEIGSGDPIVFLHGNPTSSYLWRNIAPNLAEHGRCVVPDLIGMGDSEKLPDTGAGSYRFVEHRQYLDGLMDQLDIRDRVVLVLHDWGSALGFDWARRNAGVVKGIAYMEAIVSPMSWEEWSAPKVFRAMRGPDGESMVLDANKFIESILPKSIQRALSAAEMDEYRRPFRDPGESRRPTLTWPREMPLGGEPSDVAEIVAAYADWLSGSPVPKLFINAEPGAILTGRMRAFCRTWPHQREATVTGIHFIQEDSPEDITSAIADWLPTLHR